MSTGTPRPTGHGKAATSDSDAEPSGGGSSAFLHGLRPAPAAVGDFSAPAVEERYDLVLTALNTFFSTTRVGHLAPDALLLDTIQVNQSLQSVLVVHTIMSAGGLRKVPEVCV